MSIVPPAIARLARDERLGARDIQVWLVVADVLVATEYRELVPADIAAELKLTRPVVSGALKRLTECAYLESGGRQRPNGPTSYRLPVAFAPPAPAAMPVVRGRRILSSGIT